MYTMLNIPIILAKTVFVLDVFKVFIYNDICRKFCFFDSAFYGTVVPVFVLSHKAAGNI